MSAAIWRARIVRLGALVLLLALTVGVPTVLVGVMGWRPPTLTVLRQAWRRQDVPPESAVDLGVVVFLLLWLWFCLVALSELVSVARRRRQPSLRPVRPGWVRHLVRLAMLSSAAAASLLAPTLRVDAAGGAPPGSARADSVVPPDAMWFLGGLGSALMLSAGALAAIEARRRREWRRSGVTPRTVEPPSLQVAVERTLRASNASERLCRLDMAVRAAGGLLAREHGSVLAARLGATGNVVLHLSRTVTPTDSLWVGAADTWTLPATVTIEELAERSVGRPQPCPSMLHLGRSIDGDDVFVDLEAIGALSVQSPFAEQILRTLAASLALSPFLDSAGIFTVGLDDTWPGAHHCEAFASPTTALRALLTAAGSTPSCAQSSSTFFLRASALAGEQWEPQLLVTVGHEIDDALSQQLDAVGAGRGVAVLSDRLAARNGWTLRASGSTHVLEPLGWKLHPVGVGDEQLRGVRSVLSATSAVGGPENLLPVPTVPVTGSDPAEPAWQFMVRVYGGAAVVAREGEEVQFERSKSLELVVWLAHHRERPTRSGARTALWDVDVRDATFANVVSEARRAMTQTGLPPDGDEWIARTLTDALPLHPLVVSDAELLERRVRSARGVPALDAIEVLRPGVALIEGMPFAGTGYLWNDGEGITSALVVLATGAAADLAGRYLMVGDIDGVFWATGQGLKVIAGHEELVALRMRAHAQRGDLAGVRAEWMSYERALIADPWASSTPSPKLVELRGALLGATEGMRSV